MNGTGDVRIDEIMPQLNETWPRLPFEECLLTPQVSYRKLKQKEIQSTGKIPVIDQGERFIAGYTNKEEDKYSGALPLIIFGDHTRRIKFVDFEFAVGADGTKLLRPIAAFNPRFFYYYLRALNLESQGYSRHYRFLKEVDVPLPSFAEQHRIVVKLDKLLSKLEACQKRLEKIPPILKRFRQAVLAAACSGKLTADWREESGITLSAAALLEQIKVARLEKAPNNKEREQIRATFSDSFLSTNSEIDIPESWIACSVSAIGTVSNGSTPSRKVPSYWGSNIHWISSGEVRNNIISTTRECITKRGYESCSVKLLPPGTVLLAMIGEGKTRGQTAMLEITATINQNIAAVVIDHGLLVPAYLWRWFQYQYESTREKGSGSGPQALNCQRVRELPFFLPPLEEQKEIVSRIEALFKVADQMEARYWKAKAHVDKLTQSILAKAFRGELVPTEAELARQEGRDYEPASALLESTKKERATQPLSSKSSRSSKKKRDDATRKMSA